MILLELSIRFFSSLIQESGVVARFIPWLGFLQKKEKEKLVSLKINGKNNVSHRSLGLNLRDLTNYIWEKVWLSSIKECLKKSSY